MIIFKNKEQEDLLPDIEKIVLFKTLKRNLNGETIFIENVLFENNEISELILNINNKSFIIKNKLNVLFFSVFIKETGENFIILEKGFFNTFTFFELDKNKKIKNKYIKSIFDINENTITQNGHDILESNSSISHISIFKYETILTKKEFNNLQEISNILIIDINNFNLSSNIKIDNYYTKSILKIIEYQKENLEVKRISILLRAIKNKSITSVYQALIQNKTEQTFMYQSLLRISDNNKIYLPKDFLDIALKYNLYNELTDFVLDHAAAVLDTDTFSIIVNINEPDIKSEYIKNKILSIVKSTKDKESKLILEIFDLNNFQKDSLKEIKDFIFSLKEEGVQIVLKIDKDNIDNLDFYLEYKPDFFKIDYRLIKNIYNEESKDSLRKISKFSKDHNVKTIATYIENRDIFEEVTKLNIDYSLGFLFGDPLILNI